GVHSTFAATGRTYIAPDSRESYRAKRRDAAGMARYSGGHRDCADIHPSRAAARRDPESVVDQGCALPSRSSGTKLRAFLPPPCPVQTRPRNNQILYGKQNRSLSNPSETSPATRLHEGRRTQS